MLSSPVPLSSDTLLHRPTWRYPCPSLRWAPTMALVMVAEAVGSLLIPLGLQRTIDAGLRWDTRSGLMLGGLLLAAWSMTRLGSLARRLGPSAMTIPSPRLRHPLWGLALLCGAGPLLVFDGGIAIAALAGLTTIVLLRRRMAPPAAAPGDTLAPARRAVGSDRAMPALQMSLLALCVHGFAAGSLTAGTLVALTMLIPRLGSTGDRLPRW